MFENAFEKREGEAARKYLDVINPKLDRHPYTEDAHVLTIPLSFYEGYELVEITDHGVQPPQTSVAVVKEDDVRVLDWTNGPVYALNEDAPIQLTAENVSSFVKFFFTYIAGRHGRFLICENVDDIAWKDEPVPAARKAIAKMIQPVEITSIDEDGTFHLRANMMFKDSLFESTVHVKQDGTVSLSNEELLVEDMPVVEDRFGQ